MHPLTPAYLARPWSALGPPPNRTPNFEPATHLGAVSSVVRAAVRAGSLENLAGLEPTPAVKHRPRIRARMSENSPSARTLRRALKACGDNMYVLANALEVSVRELARYVGGDEPAPNLVFMKALDLVARGPRQPASRQTKA